jgi:hypothetical protein
MHRFIESLEDRRLMSGSALDCSEAPVTAAHVQTASKVHTAAFNTLSLVGTYIGKVKINVLTTTQNIPVTIVVTSVDSQNRVHGTISAAPIGTIAFNIKQSKINKDRTFVFKYNKNGINGVLQGTYVRALSLNGDFSGIVSGYNVDGTFTLKRQ